MPEEAISGCPAENDIMKNRGLSYEKGNIIAGIVCAAVALYCHRDMSPVIRGRKLTVQVFPGPGLWPGIIAALLLICSVGLIAGTLMMKKKISRSFRCGHREQSVCTFPWRSCWLHVGVVHGWIHHPVCDRTLFAFCQWFHRGAVWKNAVISIAVILVIYYVFKNFLNVPIDFGMFSI